MDKRDLAQTFRDRLDSLIRRSGLKRSAFARAVGIDRSALTQMLSENAARLPRAETLMAIAAQQNVSLDWMLGLSQDEGVTGELRPTLEIAESTGGFDETLLAKWHGEAAGTKVRYVPANLPDLLRTPRVIAWQADASEENPASLREEADYRIAYTRQPGTDMEVCMPRQRLEVFAAGQGIWSDLSAGDRVEQLLHMSHLLNELYPSFRLHLFDGTGRYSIPYTIFGARRAAVYVGGMYLVLNATATVETLTRHFDGLIRGANIHPHEASNFTRRLAETLRR